MNRVGMVWTAAWAAGVALVSGMGVTVGAQQGARVIQMAELPDMALGVFHNSLFRSPFDQIVDDHGVRLGSLGSDLFHDPDDSYNEFWAVTDRGPNGNPGRRTFLAPKFNPVILYLRVQDRIQILDALPILDASGLPVTGLSNVEGFDETPYDFNGANVIAGNPNGVDTEGIVRTRNGHFWLADEYSPSLIHVNKDGRIIERFVPEDSLLGTTLATTPNYVVKKYLPKILNYRRQNRGFEGLAVTADERTLFIAMQSPLDYPTSALGRASRNVRILRFDIGSERVTGDFVYQFDEVCAFLGEPAGCSVAPGEMKVSGLIALSATSLLVEERTDTAAKIYRVDLSGAMNILNTSWDAVAASPNASTTALETLANPASQGIAVATKTLVVNLAALPGIPNKIEGIALVRPDVLVIANDNDFGLVDNATFDASGRLSNDTRVKSQLLYIQLASPVN
jgi:Esterase-like activity of phytase